MSSITLSTASTQLDAENGFHLVLNRATIGSLHCGTLLNMSWTICKISQCRPRTLPQFIAANSSNLCHAVQFEYLHSKAIQILAADNRPLESFQAQSFPRKTSPLRNAVGSRSSLGPSTCMSIRRCICVVRTRAPIWSRLTR